MKKIIFVFVIIAISLLACQRREQKSKPVVMVTIEPLRYFAEQIVGKDFKVETLVPKGGNPETYEPSAKQMMALAQCKAFIKVGKIGFERTWDEKLKDAAPNTLFVDSSKGIKYIESTDGVEDPHTWMSVTSAMAIAKNICDAMIKINPKDSTMFRANLKSFLFKLDSIDDSIKSILHSNKSNAFLIYHPSLTYFAHEYNLTQIPVEEEGREPSAAQLKQIIEFAKAKKAKIMLVQKEFTNRNTEIVARNAHAKQVDINPLNYDWENEIVGIARKLKE